MTLGKYLSISGTVPMLSFCLCLVIATKEKDPEYILYIGIILGVLLDLLLGHGFGSYTVIFTLSVWGTFLFRDNIFSSLAVFLTIDTVILSILLNVIYYLFHIFDAGIDFGTMLAKIAFPTAVYNTVISILFYSILKPTLYKRR
jgi:rod shape-determining protein MreD